MLVYMNYIDIMKLTAFGLLKINEHIPIDLNGILFK